MHNYADQVTNAKQSQSIFGREKEMHKNYDGAYVFTLDAWKQLDRFLIIGTEGGSYYASSRELTMQNARNLLACIKKDGHRVVRAAVDVSTHGRAPKNDMAIFALVLTTVHGPTEDVRNAAYAAISKVCRIGTDLFQFMNYSSMLRENIKRGKSSGGLRRGIRRYYENKTPDRLAYDLLKYKQRLGWSHLDLFKMIRWVPKDPAVLDIVDYVFDKLLPNVEDYPHIIEGAELVKHSKGATAVAALAETYGLSWEMIPTEYLKSPEVWEALLTNMPATALMRNLGRLSSLGMTGHLSATTKMIRDKLCDGDYIKNGRVHPISLLNAYHVYSGGRALKGSLTWSVNEMVRDSIETAFYNSFSYLEPTGLNYLLATDVSLSMTWHKCAGYALTPAQVSAAMAMTLMRSELNTHIIAFSRNIKELNLGKTSNLKHVYDTIMRQPAASTDCAAPIKYALTNRIPVDCFFIITDNETNNHYGEHASTLLRKYRKAMKRPAKMVVAGVTATNSSIADPKDAGMLDIVGFDSALPQMVTAFMKM